MASGDLLFRDPDGRESRALLRRVDDFGLDALDLVRPPSRLTGGTGPAVEVNVDARRRSRMPTPAELVAAAVSAGEPARAATRRSIQRALAWFLVCEDPQRRLEAQEVKALAHQASLVQHILQQASLQRVLIADEVGLGKTVEAGLIIRELLARQPGLRVLYLAPARLVRNVRFELERLGLAFRVWVAGTDRDARLDDTRVVASIHRAAHPSHLGQFVAETSWDLIVVDECHHLSDWQPGGGNPVQKYRLVDDLRKKLTPSGRLLLMSGTPHQGHPARFDNLLRLLQMPGESLSDLTGRVIYRTKEDVRDWFGQPLFPGRQVNAPLIIDLGPAHRAWLEHIHEFFSPLDTAGAAENQRRAAGWRCGQALQWATSSVEAGLGYLIRQAVRAGKDLRLAGVRQALEAVRPYRGGPIDEAPEQLFQRLAREVGIQAETDSIEDIEEADDERWQPDPVALSALLKEGVVVWSSSHDAKWQSVYDKILSGLGSEKVVLFAQPIETVSAVCRFLERKTGQRPARIVGSQSDDERRAAIDGFWSASGPQFLVSSRAGGEGLNLQVARHLVHLDVPWNPMEMEQRVGRVHRFGSRRTIVVDSAVVKDSREVDTYRVARDKLWEIASTMGPPDRFESLYSRVMALVPPDEFQDILGERPLGPLSDSERQRVADLVTAGYRQWSDFHSRFADQQERLARLDPGQATWEDLSKLAQEQLKAKPASGFTALRFLKGEGKTIDASVSAEVLEIGQSLFVCGDYGGMPVTRDDGARAEPLGLNVEPVASTLRALAFPDGNVGAAFVRWPAGSELPLQNLELPFGVLVLARQTVRSEANSWVEIGSALAGYVVTAVEPARSVDGRTLASLLRAMQEASARQESEAPAGLIEAMQREERSLIGELRRPTDADREARIAHAVTPLMAAVVS